MKTVIDSVLDDLNKTFGTTKKPLAATTGMIHDYLGITIDYSEIDRVKFTMYDYLEDILNEMPDNIVEILSRAPVVHKSAPIMSALMTRLRHTPTHLQRAY
jgi:hypothetical protein